MATTFAAGLGGYLAEKPKLTKQEKRLQEILDAKPSRLRTALLRAMEAHARAHLGIGPKEKIDWSAVDWQKVFSFILQLFMFLAPLFL